MWKVGCVPPIEDQQALKDLILQVHNLPSDWNINDLHNACNWTGLRCELPQKECIQLISLENRNLFGTLNESIGNMNCLTALYLANNNLYGSLPASIFNGSTIYMFDLANNAFSSTLPEIGEGQRMSYFNISGNKLRGCIPSSYNQLEWFSDKFTFCDVRSNYFDCETDYCTNALPVFCYKGCPEPSTATVSLMVTEILLIAFATFVLGMLVAAFIVFMYSYYSRDHAKKHDYEAI
jgi:hypothetical protein